MKLQVVEIGIFDDVYDSSSELKLFVTCRKCVSHHALATTLSILYSPSMIFGEMEAIHHAERPRLSLSEKNISIRHNFLTKTSASSSSAPSSCSTNSVGPPLFLI